MCPLPLLVVVAVKVLGVVTTNHCNDSNFTIVSALMDICARIKIISRPCCTLHKHTPLVSKVSCRFAHVCTMAMLFH